MAISTTNDPLTALATYCQGRLVDDDVRFRRGLIISTRSDNDQVYALVAFAGAEPCELLVVTDNKRLAGERYVRLQGRRLGDRFSLGAHARPRGSGPSQPAEADEAVFCAQIEVRVPTNLSRANQSAGITRIVEAAEQLFRDTFAYEENGNGLCDQIETVTEVDVRSRAGQPAWTIEITMRSDGWDERAAELRYERFAGFLDHRVSDAELWVEALRARHVQRFVPGAVDISGHIGEHQLPPRRGYLRFVLSAAGDDRTPSRLRPDPRPGCTDRAQLGARLSLVIAASVVQKLLALAVIAVAIRLGISAIT